MLLARSRGTRPGRLVQGVSQKGIQTASAKFGLEKNRLVSLTGWLAHPNEGVAQAWGWFRASNRPLALMGKGQAALNNGACRFSAQAGSVGRPAWGVCLGSMSWVDCLARSFRLSAQGVNTRTWRLPCHAGDSGVGQAPQRQYDDRLPIDTLHHTTGASPHAWIDAKPTTADLITD